MKTLFLSLAAFFALFEALPAQEAKLIGLSRGHTTKIDVYTFTPNGERIYILADAEMQVWNVGTKQLERTFPIQQSFIRMEVSSDERYIIGSELNWRGPAEIYRYNAETGEKLPSIKTTTTLQYPQVSALTFLQGGKKFAAYIWLEKDINVYNTESGDLEYSFPVTRNGKEIRDLGFAPDGSIAFVAYSDSAVYLYSLTNGDVTDTINAGYMVASVDVSADGKFLITGGSRYATEKPIRVFSITSGDEIAKWEGVFDSNYPAISYDGAYAAYSGDVKGYFYLYETLHPNIKRTIRIPVEINGLQFSPGNNYIAGKATDGKLWLWNAEDGEIISSFSNIEGGKHNGSVNGISVSPDNACIATIGDDCYLKLWDLKTGALKKSMSFESPGSGNCVSYSGDNKFIAVGIGSDIVKISTADYTTIGTVAGVSAKSFDWHKDTTAYKDGPNDLLIGGNKGLATCGESGANYMEVDTSVYNINTVAFYNDGEKIISGSRDKHVRIYREGGIGSQLWQLDKDLVADEDNNFYMPGVVAVGSLDKLGKFFSVCHSSKAKAIWIWDALEYKVVAKIPFETDFTNYPLGGMMAAIATNAQDKIITGDNGGMIRVYDVETGKILCRIDTLSMVKLGNNHPDITSLSISKDDKYLAAAFSDGSILVYDISDFIKGVPEGVRSHNSLVVFPNPAENYLYINAEANQCEPIQIYSPLGVKVMENGFNNRLDISNLAPGSYFIKIGELRAGFVKR